MDERQPFYITTTLPYVNAAPHMGHALEFVRADIIARTKAAEGRDVFFNTGTDEHGLKIFRKAEEEGVDPQAYVDRMAEGFRELTRTLNMMPELHFIRTTDEKHIEAAQAFWMRCFKNGDIYKKNYSITYCVGCELEKTHSDLVDGRCPEHPDKELEHIEEENYFFRYSAYQKHLVKLFENTPDFVVPSSRLTEIKAFIERGLEDFSISRLKSKMPWGIPVPNDPEHVMYVWFDALVSYIATLDWPHSAKAPLGTAEEEGQFDRYWSNGTPTQYAGKDNLRQQSAMWQAMLLSAGLPPSRRIVINGFVISEGRKMSKSIGNVIDPMELIEEYGVDALRYYIARELQSFEDSDLTKEKFRDAYNANLANGLGNVVSRVMKMAETALTEPVEVADAPELPREFVEAMDQFNMNTATDHIWSAITSIDREIQEKKPFTLPPEEAEGIVRPLVEKLSLVAAMLTPVMPETADKIREAVRANTKPEPLFMRK